MRVALVAFVVGLASGVAHADLAPPPPEPAEGTWYGQMRQVDVDGEESYPMTLRLTEAGGRTDYPKQKCAGELKRVGTARGGYVVYKETITRGGAEDGKPSGCVDGVVIVHVDDDELVLGWFGAF